MPSRLTSQSTSWLICVDAHEYRWDTNTELWCDLESIPCRPILLSLQVYMHLLSSHPENQQPLSSQSSSYHRGDIEWSENSTICDVMRNPIPVTFVITSSVHASAELPSWNLTTAVQSVIWLRLRWYWAIRKLGHLQCDMKSYAGRFCRHMHLPSSHPDIQQLLSSQLSDYPRGNIERPETSGHQWCDAESHAGHFCRHFKRLTFNNYYPVSHPTIMEVILKDQKQLVVITQKTTRQSSKVTRAFLGTMYPKIESMVNERMINWRYTGISAINTITRLSCRWYWTIRNHW